MTPFPLQPTWGNPCQACGFANWTLSYCRIPGHVGMFLCERCCKRAAEALRMWFRAEKEAAKVRALGANDPT